MARLCGVDLPRNKKLNIALTYIYGIGNETSKKVLNKTKINKDIFVKDISEDDILKLRDAIKDYLTEGDLKRKISLDIKRKIDINCYQGQRHKKKLPVRGQRTHTNARTKRGKRIAIAGKKKVTK
ncbi:MAG: 30S ribosomal protein S13 [Salinivirgaceae bacterium]|nr:30S ribosomal protein S13 [Salinivirgaceae bacterium]